MRVSKKRNMSLVSIRESRPKPDSEASPSAAPKAAKRPAKREKGQRLGMRPWPRTPRRQVTQRSAEGAGRRECCHAFGGGARVGSRRSPDCVESNSFRLPHVRATRISRTNDPRERTRTYTIRRPRTTHKKLNAARFAKVLHAGDSREVTPPPTEDPPREEPGRPEAPGQGRAALLPLGEVADEVGRMTRRGRSGGA